MVQSILKTFVFGLRKWDFYDKVLGVFDQMFKLLCNKWLQHYNDLTSGENGLNVTPGISIVLWMMLVLAVALRLYFLDYLTANKEKIVAEIVGRYSIERRFKWPVYVVIFCMVMVWRLYRICEELIPDISVKILLISVYIYLLFLPYVVVACVKIVLYVRLRVKIFYYLLEKSVMFKKQLLKQPGVLKRWMLDNRKKIDWVMMALFVLNWIKMLTYPDIYVLYMFIIYSIYVIYAQYLSFGAMYRHNEHTVDILLDIVKSENYGEFVSEHEQRIIKMGLNILLKRDINFMDMYVKYDESDEEGEEEEYPKVITWIYYKYYHLWKKKR